MTRESRVGCVCDTMSCVSCVCAKYEKQCEDVFEKATCRSSRVYLNYALRGTHGGTPRDGRDITFRALQAYNAYPPCSLDLVPSHESRARLSSTGLVAWDAQLMAAPPMRTLDTSSLGMRATHRDSHPKRWTDHVVAQPSQR